MSKPYVRFLFLGDPRTDRRLKNFIWLFTELGYMVELVNANPVTQDTEWKMDGIQVQNLRLTYSRGVRMFLQYKELLQRTLSNTEPCDILFACELYSLMAASSAKKSGKARRIFYDARELYTELPSVANNLLKKIFWKRWEQKGLRQTDLVIVTAPDDINALKEVHGFLPPQVIIRNLPRREVYNRTDYLRKKYFIPPEKKIFVYIGGLQKDRGLEKMISVMEVLKDLAVLVIIGSGALKDHLQNQVNSLELQNIVFLHPIIDSEKVIQVLSSADIGISLIEQHSKSYQLALPSKIFEYRLAGLPVISSSLKQVKDIFDKSKEIIFADPDNKSGVTEACRKALALPDSEEIRKKISEEAYNNYAFEKDAVELKNMLDSKFS